MNSLKLGYVLSHEVDSFGKSSADNLERVRGGCKLLKNSKIDFIVMSGGFVKGMPFSLANFMKKEALRLGVLEKDILLEEGSLDTVGQIITLRELMDSFPKIKETTIITSTWHMPRVKNITSVIFGDKNNINFYVVGKKNRELEQNDKRSLPIFYNTFKNFNKNSKNAYTFLLKNHPWYNGNYPWKIYNQSPNSSFFKSQLNKLKMSLSQLK